MKSLTNLEFNILYSLLMKKTIGKSQREIASYFDVSVGMINATIKKLLKQKTIALNDNEYILSYFGKKCLKDYEVKNAIIMAAGMSTRFAPLSYEMPKGLIKVKGEVLIERQIRQLKEKDINDITVVVGYMKEKFFYLEEKFGVKIIINNDYYKYNNTSTLMLVLNQLSNTYICSSDNYFIENVFEKYVYHAYYSAEYKKGKTDEYCLSAKHNDIIDKITIGGSNSWYMIGHAYFDELFCSKFIPILKKEYKNEVIKHSLWEDVYKKHIKELKLRINKYNNIIYEFDSLEDLKKFDKDYVNNINSKILINICNFFKCNIDEIKNIKVIKSGLTNNSFVFEYKNKKYVYRHPGIGTDKYINRKSEKYSIVIASKLKLDNTFLYMNEKEGYKISKYIDNVSELDYKNIYDVKKAIKLIRTLHSKNIKSKFNFNIWKKTIEFYNIIKVSSLTIDISDIFTKVSNIYENVKNDKIAKICLCHNDCYSPNFLVEKNGRMNLIDWEYSGNSDPASDIGTFICCSNYDVQKSKKIINLYFNNKIDSIKVLHFIGYVAICSLYWYVWALYQEYRGNIVGEWVYKWYKNTIMYSNEFFKLKKEIDKNE